MRAAIVVALVAGVFAIPAARPQDGLETDAGKERFLREARIVRAREIGKGVTGSLRVTLTDGITTHDAQVQRVEERKQEFQSTRGVEFDFRDSWSFNVVAYRLDRILGLHLVPATVERRYSTDPAAFTWWVDDVLMDETARLQKKIEPPRPAEWNQEMQLVRLFDQLIFNTDRNTGNLLITKDWEIWAIDHTRAFRRQNKLRTPANVTRCDSEVLTRLKQLNRATLSAAVGKYLASWDIDALLARRDLIVDLIEKAGPTALFTRTSSKNRSAE